MPDAFEQFFRDEYRGLVVFVERYGAQPADAEDVACEVMDQARRRWSELRNPRNWVRKAASHEFLKEKQRTEKRAQYARLLAADRHHHDGPTGTATEGWEHVRQSLARLPPTQRMVMALTVDGYKPEEIAELLGKPPDTVRSNLREARRKLRTWLDDQPPEH